MGASSQPLAGKPLVERPALLAALDGALGRRLTLVAAPAGAGKTTLLRQWIATHSDLNFTHLSIDSADDDPAHFTRRLITALTFSHPSSARATRSISRDGEGLGQALITGLAAALEGGPETVLLLEDVHRFTNVALVADLGKLIERVPRTVHVVIASRVDPPIALSRHRLNDELLELRPAQLAFNESESAALLENIVGHAFTPSQVHKLCDRTEGWAAGLQLAGLHLRNEPDAESFIAEFSGSDRLVADYLGEEVISGLPADRRQLLLEMSVLDDMCAGLVEAAVGSHNAQQTLEELERECMFLIPLDAQRQWFRFHHLFSELLRSRLRAENPAAELQILTAAADWHLSRSRVKKALDYLLRAQARDGAMETMLASAADDAATGVGAPVHSPVPTARNLVRTAQINEELFAGVRHAWGDESAAFPAPAAEPERNVTASAAPRRGWGFVAAQVLWRARPDISSDEARRKVGALAQRGDVRRATSPELAQALVSGGRAFFLAGNTTEARKWLSRALVASGSDVVERVSALSALSLVEAWSRNVTRADKLMRDALETARDAGMLAHPAIADAYLASVLTSLEPEADPGAEPSGSEESAHSSPATTSDARGTHHPLAAAPQTVRTDTEVLVSDDPKLVPTVLFERAAASITLGDTGPAREIVETWQQLVHVSTPLSVVQNHILRARLAAVDELPEEALRELAAALQVAEIHGFVEVFVQAGPLILQRLSMISGPQAAFSDLIRSRAGEETSQLPALGLSEPLTERELELLVYFPTRFTNVELARRFYVSVNTIKTHMAHIYRKLGATTRDGAIDRAREVGLL
ncbi:LuxR family maltose regulon positive regulatory protein [Okibacterium sp. HSC-33S16]|uniref:helix-turn-helix transcriptional regulator n=1 Tax=Okibacterium sp. HSC-33S16 TaxID=2910965 RepID=UPI00209CE553|nr:LuxR C-terminal-related transcriptional regulator [Okibacterium sp. HSC-33S16]MCP2032657.1 LuxR family maltose regulon positive regulatory protein [Okibacterium sp. HSC-33S16]